MTESIKFYYNGLRVNGEKKLVKCFYSIDNNCNDEKSVSISARDYNELPRDVFPVENHSDIYTDYFENDHAYLTEDHPLYKYARHAAIKAQITSIKKNIAYCEKRLASRERWAGDHEYWGKELNASRARLATYEAEQKTDPGQPTAADLEKIRAAAIEAENARRAAEMKAQQEERERVLNERNEGRRFIEGIAALFPQQDDAPRVLIHWSEHPAFYSWGDDELTLSLTAAEIILAHFDRRRAAEGAGYDKTKFTIYFTAPDGEPGEYSGRYDLGDNEGGLLDHIYNFGEWTRTHDKCGRPETSPESTNDVLDLVKYLRQCIAPAEITTQEG